MLKVGQIKNVSRFLGTTKALYAGSRFSCFGGNLVGGRLLGRCVVTSAFVGSATSSSGGFHEAPRDISPREVLGLPADSMILDPKDIKKAYLKAAQRYHPDTYASLKISQAEIERRRNMFTQITRAYDILLISPDLYGVLGVDKAEMEKGSSWYLNIIINNYSEKMNALQGDFNRPNRGQQIQDLQDAFRVLSDEDLRAKYDQGILDLKEELEAQVKKYKVNLESGVKPYKFWESIVVTIKVLGAVFGVLLFGFCYDEIRYYNVKNRDRYDLVTEDNFEEKIQPKVSSDETTA